MALYTTYGDVQRELERYYQEHGVGLQFPEAIGRMAALGLLSEQPASIEWPSEGFFLGEQAAYEKLVDAIPIAVSASFALAEQVVEGEIIPLMRDVFIIRHPRFTRPYPHRHDYVEINYVLHGHCTLYFEEEQQVLQQGDLCLIAPDSRHDVEILDGSFVFCVMLRRSTFETTFFSLLSRGDPLSLFFRTILRGEREPNYLMFHVDSDRKVAPLLQNALLECHRSDGYSNQCCISYVNLLFAAVLRYSSQSPRYYHYRMSGDFYLVLQYLRHHYRTLTLGELAEQFHYSKAHLCTLIKQNTGASFTSLIQQIRLDRACDYLLNTDLPIGQIAQTVGFSTADRFSRVFHSHFDCSPQSFRKARKERDDRFVPFEMK